MSQSIKNLIRTGGWKEVKNRINKAIDHCKDPSDISETLDDATYAREVRARVLAGKKMSELVKSIELSAGRDTINKPRVIR